MRHHLDLFVTATRYALVEHALNRFALVLVALFLPVWTSLTYLAIPDAPARVHLQAAGRWVAPPGNELTAVSGALNAVTLITGFLMFAATFGGKGFDRRLAMAGYPRTHLAIAKFAALTLASAAVAAYAAVVTCLTWTPRQPLLLAAALFCAAMTYGVLGVGLASVLHREVEGMFAIVMTSIIDLALQNPVMSSGANDSVVRYLPSYGAVQAATAAGFADVVPLRDLAIQIGWFTGAAFIGLIAFRHGTPPGRAPAEGSRAAKDATPPLPPA
ncbi:ABC transporter permease [Streptomyces sp. NPDC012935]|uniref:ABC transporter permease n=1 Tax=Streptomyces sp. NPDC012935 TaxID=3364857 RepID=UPI0036D017FB